MNAEDLVSMKLESAVVRLKGAEKNIQNGISFLEVRTGLGERWIMSRMIELKGLSQDVLKNSSDNDNYNRSLKTYRFSCSRCLIYFQGVSMFANLLEN